MAVKKKIVVKNSKKAIKPPLTGKSKTVKLKKTVAVKPKAVAVDVSPSLHVPRGLEVPVFSLTKNASRTVKLAKEIFAVSVNMQTVVQANRVYLANLRQGHASTKGRGEVAGSTRKIYRQKGTGRARHGSIRAPIFIGGGIVFGPKPKDFSLSLPPTVKKQALFSALTLVVQKGFLRVVEGLENIEPKTKNIVNLIKDLTLSKSRVLVVVSKNNASAVLAARNVSQVDTVRASDLNAYDVMSHESVVFTVEALEEMGKRA